MSERQFTMRISTARGLPGIYVPLLQRAQARWEVGTALSRAQAARDLEEAVRRAAAAPAGPRRSSEVRKASKRAADAALRASMKGASGGGGARR